MLNATKIKKTAKIFLRRFGEVLWAVLAPIGAVNTVIVITSAAIGRFTKPIVYGGIVSPTGRANKKPITDGTAIRSPNPAAVASDRCMVTP